MKEILGFAGRMPKLTIFRRWLWNSEQTPQGTKLMWDHKQRITTAHSIWLFCPKSLCYTKFTGSKQHDTLLLWIPAVSSLHTLAEGASELGGLTLSGSWELPQSRKSCTWVRTEPVFKRLIHHDNEGCGAGLRGCCSVRHAGSWIFGGEGRIRCSPGSKWDRVDP